MSELLFGQELIAFAKKIGAKPFVETKEVDIGELDSIPDGYLVYIQNQGKHTGYKFHICNCSTLQYFAKEHRYDYRYRLASIQDIIRHNISAKVIDRYQMPVETETGQIRDRTLKVCKNCIEEIEQRYHKTKDFHSWSVVKRDRFVNNFDLQKFFDKHEAQEIMHTEDIKKK